MTNCERCCFYELCAKAGRCENKDCIYGQKCKQNACYGSLVQELFKGDNQSGQNKY